MLIFNDTIYVLMIYVSTVLSVRISEEEIPRILQSCHAAAYGGHFGGQRIAAKVLQLGYY